MKSKSKSKKSLYLIFCFMIFTLLSFKALKYFSLNFSLSLALCLYFLLCSFLILLDYVCIIFSTLHLCHCWILYP